MKKRILLSVLICMITLLSIAFCVYAATQTKLLTVNVAFDGNVSVYVDGEYLSDAPLSRHINKDATVKLVNSSDDFMFYSDDEGNTFGYEGEYSFNMIGNTTINVWYENPNSEKVYVIYKNTNATNQILASALYKISELESVLSAHLVSDANKFGYEFSSWNKTLSDIVASATAGDTTIVVEPIYNEIDTLFSVDVVGGYISSENENDGTFKMNSNVTLTANEAEEGKKFAYWTNKSGKVISDYSTIVVTVASNELYTAHFVDENETVELAPSVSLAAAYDLTTGKILTSAQRFLPDTYTIKAYGLVYAKDVEFAEEDMTIEAVDGAELKMSYVASPQTSNGIWINRISCEEYVCVRAYMMYTDSNGQTYTVYSNATKASITEPETVTLLDLNFDDGNTSGNGYTIFGTPSVSDNTLVLNTGYIVIPVKPEGSAFVDIYTDIKFASLPTVMTDILSIDKGMVSDSVGDGITGSWDGTDNTESYTYNGGFLSVGADGYLCLYNASSKAYNKTDVAIETNTIYKIHVRYDLSSGEVILWVNGTSVASEDCSVITSEDFDLVIMDYGKSFNVVFDNIKLARSADIVCTEHSYVSVVTPSTCGKQGHTTYTCECCGDWYISDYVDPTGNHSYDNGVLNDDGTHIVYTCTACQKTYEEEISKYTVVYDSAIASSAYAHSVASSLASKTGGSFSVSEKSAYSGEKYIYIADITSYAEKYGWTVKGDVITLYFGAYVSIDTVIDKFLNSINSMSDLDELSSAEYSVDATDTYDTASKYASTSATVSMLDVSFASRAQDILASENTDLSKITGTVYYISENGDDSNNGTSASTPWKTLSKLSSATLNSGDAVVLERGGVYRGTIKAVAGVTYGCYGEGNKPIICGSAQNYAGMWTKVEGNIWKLNATGILDPGIIVFDAHLYDVDNYNEITGIRVFDYQTMSSSDTADSTTLYGYSMLDKNYEFYYGTPDMTAANFNRDSTSYTLYVYYDGNLNTDFKDIEIGEDKILFDANGIHNVTVDGICFKYTGGHCVRGGTFATNYLTVKNCVFAWSGGSILQSRWVRYGNAIEIYGSATGLDVSDNWIYEIYDTGFTCQYSGYTITDDIVWKDIDINGNLIEKCYWGIELWCSPFYTTDSSTGVVTSKNMHATNINLTNNVISKIGDSWGVYQHQNIVGGASIVLGNIAGQGSEDYIDDQPIKLENNVFDRTYVPGYTPTKPYNSTRIFAIDSTDIFTDVDSYHKYYKFVDNYIIQYSDENVGFYKGVVVSGNSYFNAANGETQNVNAEKKWTDFFKTFTTDIMTGSKVCVVEKE